MSIITRYNFEDNEQISALLADEDTNHLWTAFAKNSSGYCLLKKQGFLSPYQTYYSLPRYVDAITALAVDTNNIYVAYNDVSLLGEIFSKSNPLTVSTQLSKGAITEAPVDVKTSDGNVFYLIPGNISGTNAKIVKYNSSGVLQNTIDLPTITKAKAMATKYVYADSGVEVDSYTKLLLKCNDTVATNNFTDSSANNYTITPVGQVVLDDSQSVFGGISGRFDGSGDYLSVPNSTDWNFGSGDWTIDFRVRFNDIGGNQGFMGREDGGSFYIAKEGNSLRFNDTTGGNLSIGWSVEANRWYHIAYVKSSGTLKIYVDGQVLGSTTSGTMTDRNAPLTVGAGFTSTYYLNGWLDDVRVSKGIARWTTDFLLSKSIGNDIWVVTYDNPVKVIRVYEPFTNVYGYESTDIV